MPYFVKSNFFIALYYLSQNNNKLNVLACFSGLVKLGVAEVKSYVNRDLDEVENVEHEAEDEDSYAEGGISLRLAENGNLNGLTCDTECVTDKEEHLKEKALTLCGSGNVGFANRDGPRKSEAEDSQCFKKINNDIHFVYSY